MGHHEKVKCDEWSTVSGGILTCTAEETTEDCIAAIAVRKALPLDWVHIPTHVALLLSLPRHFHISHEAEMLVCFPYSPKPHPTPSH